MKVKCIDEGDFTYITKNKEYEVLKEGIDCYKILNDRNVNYLYHKDYFEIVKEDNKFKIGDKVVKTKGRKWDNNLKYRTITEVNYTYGNDISSNGYRVDDILAVYYYEEIELYREDNKMTKTFKEVIADIKEGEVWENKEARISQIYLFSNGNKIMFIGNDGFSINNSTVENLNSVYTLQRKKVNFTEAFKAYEEGKEIESEVTGDTFKKHMVNGVENGIFLNNEYYLKSSCLFSINALQGQWYINN